MSSGYGGQQEDASARMSGSSIDRCAELEPEADVRCEAVSTIGEPLKELCDTFEGASRSAGGNGASGGTGKVRTGGDMTCLNEAEKYPGRIAKVAGSSGA